MLDVKSRRKISGQVKIPKTKKLNLDKIKISEIRERFMKEIDEKLREEEKRK